MQTAIKKRQLLSQNEMAKLLQNGIKWDSFYRMANSLVHDGGFSSNADNFARSTMYEKALEKYSTKNFRVTRVDKDGCDLEVNIYDNNGILIYEKVRVELKTLSEYFYYVKGGKWGNKGDFKRNKIKMKNFRGDTSYQTVQRYKSQVDFDFLLVVQTNGRNAIIAENTKKLRNNYVADGDGVFLNLPNKDLYQQIELPHPSLREVKTEYYASTGSPEEKQYSSFRDEYEQKYLEQFV